MLIGRVLVEPSDGNGAVEGGRVDTEGCVADPDPTVKLLKDCTVMGDSGGVELGSIILGGVVESASKSYFPPFGRGLSVLKMP